MKPDDFQKMVARTFAKHEISKIRGALAWRCRRPGDSAYHFYVTWAPGMIVVGGDIRELVVRHYSFADPWDAAAWINGASWDYFMEKACAEREYDATATAELIIETAYRQHRDSYCGQPTGRSLEGFRHIVEEFGDTLYDDPTKAEHRKHACRELLSYADAGEFSADQAYQFTEDSESIIYRYPERYRWPYEALKLWAKWMWENEPLWHKIARRWRAFQALRKGLKSHPILWAPVLYARFEADRMVQRASYDTFFVWKRAPGGGRYYANVAPLRAFGRAWDRIGLWRIQGSSTPDRDDPGWWRRNEPQFRDVRKADLLP